MGVRFSQSHLQVCGCFGIPSYGGKWVDNSCRGALMVTMMRRRGRRSAMHRPLSLGAAAREYAAMGWPVCPGAQPSGGLDSLGMPDPGRACSCDRVGCPAPGAHPVSPTWQMQATVDEAIIGQWWEARPEANVILATGRVFDVLDVPAVAGATALSRMTAAQVETGPVAVQSSPGGAIPRAHRGMSDGRAMVSNMRPGSGRSRHDSQGSFRAQRH